MVLIYVRHSANPMTILQPEVLGQFLVGKPGGKRQLGKPRRRWENNIKMDLEEVDCGGMDWIDLAQDRDRWRARVNVVMTFGFHKMRGTS